MDQPGRAAGQRRAVARTLCPALGAGAFLKGAQAGGQPRHPAGRAAHRDSGATGGRHDDRLLAAGRGASGHSGSLAGEDRAAGRCTAHQLCAVSGIHCGTVPGATVLGGPDGQTCPGRTGQTRAYSDRRGSVATTTNKILPAQSPTPSGQMAAHDEPHFVVHLQKLRRHHDCLAALALKCRIIPPSCNSAQRI